MNKVIKKKNVSISLLKVMACLAVLALHTQRNVYLGEIYNPALYYFSRFAIPIFFLVNGYLILRKKRTAKYLIKKSMQMIFLVAIWSIIYSILKRCNPLTIFIGSIFGENGLSIFWFFWALTLVYFIIIILNKVLITKKRYLIFLVICLIVCVLFDIINNVIMLKDNFIIMKLIPQTFRVWLWLFYFYLGGYISNYINNHEKYMSKKKSILLVLLSIGAVITQYLLYFKYTKFINSEYIYGNILIVLWCICLFDSILSLDIKNPKLINIILYIEKNSIGIYVIHIFFVKLFDLTVHNGGWVLSTIIWIGLFLVSLTISTIINKIPYLNKLVNIGDKNA